MRLIRLLSFSTVCFCRWTSLLGCARASDTPCVVDVGIDRETTAKMEHAATAHAPLKGMRMRATCRPNEDVSLGFLAELLAAATFPHAILVLVRLSSPSQPPNLRHQNVLLPGSMRMALLFRLCWHGVKSILLQKVDITPCAVLRSGSIDPRTAGNKRRYKSIFLPRQRSFGCPFCNATALGLCFPERRRSTAIVGTAGGLWPLPFNRSWTRDYPLDRAAVVKERQVRLKRHQP